MDALERLSSVGADLLARVDAALAAGGAPADDPIWPLLRQVGALPADVLDFGLRLDHIALRSAATELRAVADRFARQPARLAADIGRSAWEGTGAEAFAAVWESLSEHIGEGTDPATVTGRLLATASYVDDLAGWAADLRHELAEAIARVATSAEAVTLRGSDDAATRVAAASAPGCCNRRPTPWPPRRRCSRAGPPTWPSCRTRPRPPRPAPPRPPASRASASEKTRPSPGSTRRGPAPSSGRADRGRHGRTRRSLCSSTWSGRSA
jgi:hypothetical protein